MNTAEINTCNCGNPAQASVIVSSTAIKEKLGKCKKCMLISILGAVMGWIIFLIAFFEPNMPILYKYFVLIIPVPFSVLLIAHGISYFLNKNNPASNRNV